MRTMARGRLALCIIGLAMAASLSLAATPATAYGIHFRSDARGGSIALVVELADTVGSVKQKIQDKEAILVEHQTLIFNCK